jgi:hypothetical protein
MGYRYAHHLAPRNNAPQGCSHDSSIDQDGGAGARRGVRVRRAGGCGAKEGRPSPDAAFDPGCIAAGCDGEGDEDALEAAGSQETDGGGEENKRQSPPGNETALTSAPADEPALTDARPARETGARLTLAGPGTMMTVANKRRTTASDLAPHGHPSSPVRSRLAKPDLT